MKTHTLLSLASLLISLIDIALCADYHISSADGLIDFSSKVNKGTDYEGTTVFLDSDIDFSEATSTFSPIGTEEITLLGAKKFFRGTFDGQGHTINNLTITFDDKHTGLFGYSTGMTVKNVVMGPTCTVESTYDASLDNAYFGGIIGECEAKDGDCTIENSVNMGDVTFSGTISKFIADRYSIGGGIYSRFSSEDDKHNAIMRNCANYGTVTQTGTSPVVYLGGLRGGCHGTSSHPCIVENCINAGDVIFDGSAANELYVGGLGGKIYANQFTSCASIGGVYSNQTTESIGAFAGKIGEGITTLTNCIWTESTEMTSAYGTTEKKGEVQSDTTSSATSTLNAATLAILNNNTNGNKWLLNTGGYTVEFYVNGRLTLSTNSLLIQQPDFGEDGSKSVNFNGWYSDASCTDMFVSTEIGSSTRLYGTYGVLYTITFILNSTSQAQSKQSNGTIITYPTEISEVGHSFAGWNTSGYVTVPEQNITFTAQWNINNYTVTFDLGNGTSFNTSFEYDDNITFPENLTMINYTFVGWNNTDNNIEMPAYDITFTAQWVKGELSNWVEIVFNNKGITEEEAKDIIKKYGDFSFTIEEFGTNDDSNAFIIIKFNDSSEAMNFVEDIREGSDFSASIKSVNFISEPAKSLSHTFIPLFLFHSVLAF